MSTIVITTEDQRFFLAAISGIFCVSMLFYGAICLCRSMRAPENLEGTRLAKTTARKAVIAYLVAAAIVFMYDTGVLTLAGSLAGLTAVAALIQYINMSVRLDRMTLADKPADAPVQVPDDITADPACDTRPAVPHGQEPKL